MKKPNIRDLGVRYRTRKKSKHFLFGQLWSITATPINSLGSIGGSVDAKEKALRLIDSHN